MLWFALGCILTAGAAPEDHKAFRFDFTPLPVSTSEGYTAVGANSLYSAKSGFGWLKGWGTAVQDDAVGDPLLRGSIGAPDSREARFLADVPNGAYEVEIISGVLSPTEGRIGTCVSVQDKVLIQPPGIGGYGKVERRTVPVIVSEGQLDMKFFLSGTGGSYRLNLFALTATPVTEEAAVAKITQQWMEAPLLADLGKAKVIFNGKEFSEVGRRFESAPGQWLQRFLGRSALFFNRNNPGDILDYSKPREKEVMDHLDAFGSPGETQPFSFGVFALDNLTDVRVKLHPLQNGSQVIPSENIEVRTVTCLPQSPVENIGSTARIAPELLEENIPFDLIRGTTQPLYLLVKIPDHQAPGVYSGLVTFTPSGKPAFNLRLRLRVLPLKLENPPGKVWNLYSDSQRWFNFSRQEMRNEIDDMAAHGINSLKIGMAPRYAAYQEEKGKIVNVDYGRIAEGLRYAASIGIDGPLEIGGTETVAAQMRGWTITHNDQAKYEVVQSADGNILKVENKGPASRFQSGTDYPADIPSGEPIRLEVVYKMSGSGTANASIAFRTLQRVPHPSASVNLPLVPTDGDWKTLAVSARVPDGHPENMLNVSFHGGPGKLEVQKVSLVGQDGVTNYVCNSKFARSIEPFNENEPWPQSAVEDYKDAIRAHVKAAEDIGFKEVYIIGTDESGNNPKTEHQELTQLKLAKEAGAKTWCNLSVALATKNHELLDAVGFYPDLLGDQEGGEEIIRSFHSLGKKVYLVSAGTYAGQDYDIMPNRYLAGYFFWKSGTDGAAIWTYQRFAGDPLNDFDSTYKDHYLVAPPREKGGDPIPTIAWEGIREGWRDYRYINALEVAVAKAEKGSASSGLGSTVLDFLKNRVPWYDKFSPDSFDNKEADNLRWLAAWTVMTMDGNMGEAPGQGDPRPGNTALSVKFSPVENEPVSPPIFVPGRTDSLKIDGSLNDSTWNEAREITDFKVNGTSGAAAVETRAYLLHDSENIYLGFKCYEPAMDNVKTIAREQDGEIFADESIEMFFDTNNDEFSYFQLAFNAAGSKYDSRCAGGVHYGENIFNVAYGKKKIRDVSWNGDWTVRTSRFPDRWEAEVSIPFASIGRESDLWGILLGRNRLMNGRVTFANKAIGMFHQPEKFVKTLLTGARTGPGKVREWKVPAPLFGQSTASFAIDGPKKFQAICEVSGSDGKKVEFSKWTEGGKVELPYQVAQNSVGLRFSIRDATDTVISDSAMPITTPDPLVISAPRRIFKLNEPAIKPEFKVAINLSPSSRQGAEMKFQLLKNGRTLQEVRTALESAECRLELNALDLTEGVYVIRAAVTKENQEDIATDYMFAVIPQFIQPEAQGE